MFLYQFDLFKMTWQSLSNRKWTALLTVLSIALSVVLLLGVEKIRVGAKSSFLNTISGTDVVVGARAGSVQLLLYSVFRIGDATANISWQSVQDIESRPEVKWVVPISLGDSHRGFRVLGTSKAYFDHFRYRRDKPLEFQKGQAFSDLYEAVIGADVAENLGYKVGDQIEVAHGSGRVSFGAIHKDKPFNISGILRSTGTPVDKSVHVSMEAIEAIHVGWEGGAAPRGDKIKSAEEVRHMELQPKSATALFVGLKSRIATFSFQRSVNNYKEEALSAILPGVAFGELWSIVGSVEIALLAVSLMVVFTAFLGMMISILGSLNERRREIAILRSVGARPAHIFTLFLTEAGILAIAGMVTGVCSVYILLLFAAPMIEQNTGLFIELTRPDHRELSLLAVIVAGGFIAGLIPAFQAYKTSLSDGLIVRT